MKDRHLAEVILMYRTWKSVGKVMKVLLSSTFHHFPPFSTPYQHPSSTFLHCPSLSPISPNPQYKHVIHTSSSTQHLSSTFHHFPPIRQTHHLSTLYILVVQPNIYPPLSIIFPHFPHPTKPLLHFPSLSPHSPNPPFKYIIHTSSSTCQ